MSNMKNKLLIHRLVLTGILAAVVAVLQVFSGYIHFGPFSITVALIPIIVGGAICGPLSGAFLGLVMSVVVLINDAGAFLALDPIGTVVTVLLKGTLAGLCSGLVYMLLKPLRMHFIIEVKGKEKWRTDSAVAIAAVISPVVNTGIFLLGCKLFFMPLINEWAAANEYENVGRYMIVGLVGTNFIFELATVIILCPVIARLIELAGKLNGRLSKNED